MKSILHSQSDLVLMMKDTPVMYFSFRSFQFKIYDLIHLPYQLKARRGIVKMSSDNCSKEEIFYTFELISKFLAMRILAIDRDNAKKILNLLGLSQSQDLYTKRNIALSCRAVSLQDNYWVKGFDESISWSDVSLRTNSLSRAVTQVALHGSSITLQGRVRTPELTTQGTYAKAWKREKNDLYLYKRGTKNGNESHIEVEVSHLLDKLRIPHVKYLPAKSQGVYCCKCKCMTTDKYSVLTALDFFTYCKAINVEPRVEMFRYEQKLIYQMLIVDYLFSNSDRHFQNWGFYYDCDTMEIKGCHPLFDHNNAFDDSLMFNVSSGGSQVFTNKTMLEAAKYGVSKLGFILPKGISASDFIDRQHYKSFKFKARNLGLLPEIKLFGFMKKL